MNFEKLSLSLRGNVSGLRALMSEDQTKLALQFLTNPGAKLTVSEAHLKLKAEGSPLSRGAISDMLNDLNEIGITKKTTERTRGGERYIYSSAATLDEFWSALITRVAERLRVEQC